MFASPLRAADHTELRTDAGMPRLRAVKRVSARDPYMGGHFPGLTVLPAVFLLEGLRQATAEAFGLGRPPEVLEVRSARLLAPMLGGDEITFDVPVDPQPDGTSWLLDARCTRQDGVPVATLKVLVGIPDPARELLAPMDPPAPSGAAPVLDHVRIRELLPVRHPMLLVDRVDALEPGRHIATTKAVSGSELCYQGLPEGLTSASYAYPRALALESFGQSAALLWLSSEKMAVPDGVLMLAAIRKARFAGGVQPGGAIRHTIRLEQLSSGTAFLSGAIWSGERCVGVVDSLIAVHRPRAEVGAAPEAHPEKHSVKDVEAGHEAV
ncbi:MULTISPECIES: hypothetical protein [Streptomyces]|uniref:hypothetical protein n=1 Tax=Streptomyces TaxID=1883 RepID=UPI00163D02A6|nr:MULTISPECIES: hypothetical protein [Streptomyces]MBC2875739.1 hypothetical protein [Streptomyces sp. TYQ1024]UBI37592.1 hypothetical protein K7I03_14700 [Streptomyces mobaraensis]UKW30180.1 hypothetical protein MCU78_14665 [Streptomyces sp. TYQ1024]